MRKQDKWARGRRRVSKGYVSGQVNTVINWAPNPSEKMCGNQLGLFPLKQWLSNLRTQRNNLQGLLTDCWAPSQNFLFSKDQESALLTSSQVMLVLLVKKPHFENHPAKQCKAGASNLWLVPYWLRCSIAQGLSWVLLPPPHTFLGRPSLASKFEQHQNKLSGRAKEMQVFRDRKLMSLKQ